MFRLTPLPYGPSLLALLLIGGALQPALAQPQAKLNQPTERLARGLDRAPLADALAFLSDRHGLKIEIDEAAFKKAGLQLADKPTIELWPMPKVKLATVLEMIATQVTIVDGGAVVPVFVVKGEKVVLSPGKRSRPVDLSKTSPVAKLLNVQTDRFKKGLPDVRLRDAVDFMREGLKLPIVVDLGSFRAAGKDTNDLQTRLAATPMTTAGEALKQILKPLSATYVVRGDHILIFFRESDGVPAM